MQDGLPICTVTLKRKKNDIRELFGMPKAYVKSRKPVYGISGDIGIVDFLGYTAERSFVTVKTFSFLELNLSILPGFNVDFIVDNFVLMDTCLGKKT